MIGTKKVPLTGNGSVTNPSSRILKTPAPEVPAYRMFCPLAPGASAKIRTLRLLRPSLKRIQLAPPSLLLNTPLPEVAAYRVLGFFGSTTRADMLDWVPIKSERPWLMANQLAPPSVLLNRP